MVVGVQIVWQVSVIMSSVVSSSHIIISSYHRNLLSLLSLQALAWYGRHIDPNFVYHLTCGTVDSETSRKVFVYFEQLTHGLAVYAGLVTVARLGSLVGPLLYLLLGMGLLAPLVYSVIVLLLDLYISHSVRVLPGTLIGLASFKMVILNLVPLGLLLCWILTHCDCCFSSKKRRTSREVASSLITAVLVIFHMAAIAQFVVYVIQKTVTVTELKLELIDVDIGLTEATYLLAALALPWAWVLGLLIPLSDNNQSLDMNLKLAKQNKQRNVIRKPSHTNESHVGTPPTSPMKFSPSVTSSPSVHTMEAASVLRDPGTRGERTPEKRRSYLEAVSSSDIHLLEAAPPRQARSEEPLWLPTGKPIEL